MIEMLFIGGHQHKKLNAVAGNFLDGPNSMTMDFPVPFKPDLTFDGPDMPIRMDFDRETYRCRKIRHQDWIGWVYILVGLKDQNVAVYLEEPGMVEQLRRSNR